MRIRNGSILAATLVVVMTSPVATQSPPPYPDDASLSFEQVGPSAWHVVEPDLDCERELFGMAEQTAVAPDGRVWLLDYREGVRELGSCRLDIAPSVWGWRDQKLAPDGTLWVLDADRLMSWDGTDWTVHVEGEFTIWDCVVEGRLVTQEEAQGQDSECSLDCTGQTCFVFLDIGPDGSIWLSGPGTLGAYDGDGWRDYTEDWMGELDSWPRRPGFGPDGAVWVHGGDGLYVFYP